MKCDVAINSKCQNPNGKAQMPNETQRPNDKEGKSWFLSVGILIVIASDLPAKTWQAGARQSLCQAAPWGLLRLTGISLAMTAKKR
jgi:hypothetical protein